MNQPPLAAQWPGYGGLLPFGGLALVSLWIEPPSSALFASALLAFGASILSFMGAIHWGLAMRDVQAPDHKLLLWGVLPSLAAWLALLAGAALGLWVCFAVDRRVYPLFALQGWLPMRLALTTVATLACGLVAWSLR